MIKFVCIQKKKIVLITVPGAEVSVFLCVLCENSARGSIFVLDFVFVSSLLVLLHVGGKEDEIKSRPGNIKQNIDISMMVLACISHHLL